MITEDTIITTGTYELYGHNGRIWIRIQHFVGNRFVGIPIEELEKFLNCQAVITDSLYYDDCTYYGRYSVDQLKLM